MLGNSKVTNDNKYIGNNTNYHSSSAEDDVQYVFIADYCSTEEDQFLDVFVNSNGGNGHQIQFALESFQFCEETTEIYLHCEVSIFPSFY